MRVRLVVISFKADPALNDMLERAAKKLKISKSEVIRRAIRHYASRHDGVGLIYETRRVKVYDY